MLVPVYLPVSTVAGGCTPSSVADSDYATADSITGTTGQTVVVTCDSGYSGGGTATCSGGGTFNVLTCTGACRRFTALAGGHDTHTYTDANTYTHTRTRTHSVQLTRALPRR